MLGLSLFLLLMLFRTPVREEESPTFGVGLFTSFSLIYLILHKKLRGISLVILDHVKLTILTILPSCSAPDNHKSILCFFVLPVRTFYIIDPFNM